GNTRTPVPAQVAFRLDFPRWRSGFGPRARAVLDALAAGGRTNEVARELGLSPARVSQMRREFEQGWEAVPPARGVREPSDRRAGPRRSSAAGGGRRSGGRRLCRARWRAP